MILFSRPLFFLVFLLLLLSSCKEEQQYQNKTVEVKKIDNNYVLFRHGKPYYIKGAGGTQQLSKIKEAGGNSIRTWSPYNADSILNEAHKHGLTVTLGLDVISERHGFDYNNKKAVRQQLERIKKLVLKHKDHPALLMWGIGNELNVYSPRAKVKINPKVWDAVNDIAQMIHEIDPNHPTTTMIVPYRRTIWQLKRKCPDLDILSVNTFGPAADMPSKIREPVIGWNGPYIISEWGPLGWWEVDRTIWDAPIEATTTKKAEFYKERYETSIKKDKEYCLGSYVFYWGQKQEKTPTWFSMFTEDGKETEAVQTMEYIWTGKSPENKAPQVSYMLLNDKGAMDNIFINSNAECTARLIVQDPDNDSLQIKWEIRPDLIDNSGGGDQEEIPLPVTGLFMKGDTALSFRAPMKEGPYRLYVYVSDGKHHVAATNTPFYVIE